mmetsp:Transcript_23892/g.65984  ORF Transcript_23892/g.65984 Transcript_23892/m.65984 type:complete len:254 (+) Transcript_23892:541-1302(+)
MPYVVRVVPGVARVCFSQVFAGPVVPFSDAASVVHGAQAAVITAAGARPISLPSSRSAKGRALVFDDVGNHVQQHAQPCRMELGTPVGCAEQRLARAQHEARHGLLVGRALAGVGAPGLRGPGLEGVELEVQVAAHQEHPRQQLLGVGARGRPVVSEPSDELLCKTTLHEPTEGLQKLDSRHHGDPGYLFLHINLARALARSLREIPYPKGASPGESVIDVRAAKQAGKVMKLPIQMHLLSLFQFEGDVLNCH